MTLVSTLRSSGGTLHVCIILLFPSLFLQFLFFQNEVLKNLFVWSFIPSTPQFLLRLLPTHWSLLRTWHGWIKSATLALLQLASFSCPSWKGSWKGAWVAYPTPLEILKRHELGTMPHLNQQWTNAKELLFGSIDICCLCLKQLQLTSANLNYHYVIKINDEETF